MFRKKQADRIKVAHTTGWLHFGGKENGIVNLVNSLDPDVFENYIFTFVRDGAFTERIDPRCCRVVELGDKLGGDYRLYFKLARQFRKHKIHIAHTHSFSTLMEGIIGAKMAFVPIIVHGEHGTIKKDSMTHIRVQRFMWGVADRVLSVSHVLRDQLSETIGFPSERIHVVANGVDLNGFQRPRGGADLRATLGLPANAKVFGTVGRMVPVKAHPVLLDACRQVFGEIPEAYMLIAGEGPLRDELTRLAEEYGVTDRVKFLGWQSDVQPVLAALDVFVLNSHSEGMSNTILEAMAAGLPVVATAVGGNVELVNDRETGLLIPPNDPRALAAAVVELLRDDESRSAMGHNSRQRVLREFSLETMASNYAKHYVELFLRRFEPTDRLRSRLET